MNERLEQQTRRIINNHQQLVTNHTYWSSSSTLFRFTVNITTIIYCVCVWEVRSSCSNQYGRSFNKTLRFQWWRCGCWRAADVQTTLYKQCDNNVQFQFPLHLHSYKRAPGTILNLTITQTLEEPASLRELWESSNIKYKVRNVCVQQTRFSICAVSSNYQRKSLSGCFVACLL